jgi:hypothetical protein
LTPNHAGRTLASEVIFVRARLFVRLVCVGLLVCRGPMFAHHAFDTEFDEKDRITLKGTLTKMEWVNPHAWIYISVKGPDGKLANWAIETAAPAALLRRGVRKNDFRVGMQLTVDGYRAKTKTATAAGRIVRLMDGTELFLR